MVKTEGPQRRDPHVAKSDALVSVVGDVLAPDLQEAQEWPINVPVRGLGRLVGTEHWDENDHLLAFTLSSQMQLASGEWANMITVGSATGSIRVEYFSNMGKLVETRTLFAICNLDDIIRGLQEAEKLLLIEWHNHARRWRDGC